MPAITGVDQTDDFCRQVAQKNAARPPTQNKRELYTTRRKCLQFTRRNGGIPSSASNDQHPRTCVRAALQFAASDQQEGTQPPHSGKLTEFCGGCDEFCVTLKPVWSQGGEIKSMTATPFGASNTKVEASGCRLMRASENEITVLLPNRSSRLVPRISPV